MARPARRTRLTVARGRPFELTIESEGIDSLTATAYAWSGTGPVGFFRYDSAPSGGGSGDDHVWLRSCLELVPVDCSPDAGWICLRCSELPDPFQLICPAPRAR